MDKERVQAGLKVHDQLRSSLMLYLTGRLTEEEAARFEERLMADQEFSDAAAACEQEVIDAYALETWDAEDRAALRPWIEVSPRRMQRVKMARALLAKKPQSVRRNWLVAAVAAIAACVLAAVALTLSLVKRPSGNTSPAVSPTPSEQAVAPLDRAGSQSAPPRNPQVILLVAERVRGQQQIETRSILRDAPIEIQVLLPLETDVSGYTLALSSLEEGGRVHVVRKNLQTQSAQGRLYLSATFASGALPPGRYRLAVSRGKDTLVAQFALKQE